MDPIAHTLLGGALAQTGLAKRSRFGGAALVLGANLPDIDGLAYFWGGDAGLCFRRGWTHGLPAVVALPILLTAVLVLLGRFGSEARSNARAWPLLQLSLLATATHPALDWLNTYGMRWLMPFEGRWFYGDAVFIIDPWIWLALGGAVFLGHSKSRATQVAWALLAGLTSLLILFAIPSLVAAKLLWVIGVILIVFLKRSGFPRTETIRKRLGVAALTATTLYIGFMLFSTHFARSSVLHQLAQQGIEVEDLMVGPVPINPFVRDVVVATSKNYRYGSLELIPRAELYLEDREIPYPPQSPTIEKAFRSPSIRGFTNWARFPWVEVETTSTGCIVHILDARYTRTRSAGFGSATVATTEPCPTN